MTNSKSNIKKTLGELAKLVGGDVAGDRSVIIAGVAAIDIAEEGDITFIANPKYIAQIQTTRASAIIISPDIKCPEGKNALYAKNPYLAFAKVLELFYSPAKPYNGIHPDACIHQTAVIGESVSIYPNVFVDEGAKIGNRVVLYPGVYIGNNAEVGDDTVLYSNVSVREGCLIGKRVIIHCNSVIGSDGFGYAKDGTKYHKIPQKGIVRIEDNVEIGACVTIDRATLGETIVRSGAKIDNLVQIAHNVTIGEDSIIVAQVGIAGSAKIGKRVTLAGQVGVNGHIEIGDDVMIGAQSGVTSDVNSQQIYSGMPAIPHKEWLKAQTIFAKLPEMRKTLMELEKRVRGLEDKSMSNAKVQSSNKNNKYQD